MTPFETKSNLRYTQEIKIKVDVFKKLIELFNSILTYKFRTVNIAIVVRNFKYQNKFMSPDFEAIIKCKPKNAEKIITD